jgi:Protein of unknown function (DUF1007)
MRWRFSLAVATMTVVVASGALAHPHGTVQCGLAVDYKEGLPHRLTGRLLFDQAHSAQASAVLRDPVTQELDEAMQMRFLFGLRQQLARWNWLFEAKSDGNIADLAEASSPTLWWSSDGRLGVNVQMSVAATSPAGAAWVFSCRDPSLYWVSEFLQPEEAVTLAGCAQAITSPSIKVATGPQAGTASVEVRCMR